MESGKWLAPPALPCGPPSTKSGTIMLWRGVRHLVFYRDLLHRCTGCTGFFRKGLACNPGHPQASAGSSPEPASGAGNSRLRPFAKFVAYVAEGLRTTPGSRPGASSRAAKRRQQVAVGVSPWNFVAQESSRVGGGSSQPSHETLACGILQKARLIGVHSCPFVVRRFPLWINLIGPSRSSRTLFSHACRSEVRPRWLCAPQLPPARVGFAV